MDQVASIYPSHFMDAFSVSTGVVALAEIGDKTQLLAFVLAARFKRPLLIALGILVATLINHGLAGYLGAWITSVLDPDLLRYTLASSFIAMAVWIMIPDSLVEDHKPVSEQGSVFAVTFVSFFMAEMGDKTQIATVAMAAHYGSALSVVLGTTLGMMIANVPAVYLGEKLAGKIPMRLVHGMAALIFVTLGSLIFLGLDTNWLNKLAPIIEKAGLDVVALNAPLTCQL